MKNNPRMNARGAEVYSKIDEKTGEVLPPRPRAVDMGFQTRQRSLKELLAATTRDPSPYFEDNDDDSDDDSFDIPDVSPNPLQTEHTPHTIGFDQQSGMSDARLIKLANSRGYKVVGLSKDDSSPVVKKTPAKSGPTKQAPEPSPETSGEDPE